MNTSLPIKSTPRDVFLYLLAIITLYINVWRFIDLLFEYINKIFPDKLQTFNYGFSANIRLSIATLIVVFPVYLGVTWFLRKDSITYPEKREMRVRKWLLNFTLFLAAVTIIVDLVTLVNGFLNGDLTARFGLKVIVVLLVAGAVFTYYFWDLRRETVAGSKPSRVLAIILSAVILGSIVAGFFIIGSPVAQRNMRFDSERTQSLQNIQYQVVNYWQQKRVLPATLADLKDDISGFIPPVDAETGAAFEYRVTGTYSFELCANFALSSAENPDNAAYSVPYTDNWNHEKGRACFVRTIDPEIYKPIDRGVLSPKAVPVM